MDFRKIIFKYRGYTPIPFFLVLLYQSNMTWLGVISGLVLALCGEWIRLNGVRVAGGRTRTRNVGAKKLSTGGPFAYIRNPLYLGNIMIYAGMALFAGGPWVFPLFIIALLYFSIQYGLIISLEEKVLLNIFGKQYEEYCSNVPRLIPRLTPWKKQQDVTKLPLKSVFHTERRTLQSFIIVVIIIISKEILKNILHVIR
ncbi:MAG: isoprenylcysteine carboxylmethyltransferase family protein [Candidatus Neomarinimicrobiota bacterium]|nr:MAG: isoprenylcysteine carboxylmethyltransferase family protein [Candidatus Neomarinimicrobiota bacterium]